MEDILKGLGGLGNILGAAIALILLTGATLLEFHWECPFCGKIATGNLFKFIFMICDHERLR